MEVHVLNGDALAYKFPVEGQVIVAREAMIDGPVQADSAVSTERRQATTKIKTNR